MANNSGKGSGSNKGGGKARSVGAAAPMAKPNGAILDDTAEVLLQRSQRFKAWKKGYRDQSLKPSAEPTFNYNKSPKP